MEDGTTQPPADWPKEHPTVMKIRATVQELGSLADELEGRRLDYWSRPTLRLIRGGADNGHATVFLSAVDAPMKTYAVQFERLDGRTSTAGVYDSPDGKLPRVDDVIPVDERGGRARVTAVSRSDHPPIRAKLVR
jgi:hypothetical protein